MCTYVQRFWSMPKLPLKVILRYALLLALFLFVFFPTTCFGAEVVLTEQEAQQLKRNLMRQQVINTQLQTNLEKREKVVSQLQVDLKNSIDKSEKLTLQIKQTEDLSRSQIDLLNKTSELLNKQLKEDRDKIHNLKVHRNILIGILVSGLIYYAVKK